MYWGSNVACSQMLDISICGLSLLRASAAYRKVWLRISSKWVFIGKQQSSLMTVFLVTVSFFRHYLFWQASLSWTLRHRSQVCGEIMRIRLSSCTQHSINISSLNLRARCQFHRRRFESPNSEDPRGRFAILIMARYFRSSGVDLGLLSVSNN